MFAGGKATAPAVNKWNVYKMAAVSSLGCHGPIQSPSQLGQLPENVQSHSASSNIVVHTIIFKWLQTLARTPFVALWSVAHNGGRHSIP